MARDNPVSRRTALKITGAAASTALVAGCSGGNGDGNGNGNGDSDGPAEISSDTDIRFTGEGTSWYGEAPDSIADAENPAISLVAGETYSIGWTGGDGRHNMEIRNSDDEVVGDYSTDPVQASEIGDGQTLDVEVTEEMAEYVCQPHEGSDMRGDIEVRDE